jgi:diguanylate cyclase (GGDEF)-like protein
VLCDVDSFKSINDEYGHDRGDAVLRDVAYELRKRLRSFELVYRLGGEEFLVVLPGLNRSEGMEIAERLREAVEQAHPTGIHLTISLGLSMGAGDQVTYDRLFKAADQALYEAKRAGRNCVMAAPSEEVEATPPSEEVKATPLTESSEQAAADTLATPMIGDMLGAVLASRPAVS